MADVELFTRDRAGKVCAQRFGTILVALGAGVSVEVAVCPTDTLAQVADKIRMAIETTVPGWAGYQ